MGTSRNTGSRAAGDYGHCKARATANNVLNVLNRLRPYDGDRKVALQQWPLIGRVRPKNAWVLGKLADLQATGQLLQEAMRHVVRR